MQNDSQSEFPKAAFQITTPVSDSVCVCVCVQVQWSVYIPVCSILLLQAISHVRDPTDSGILWLHNAGLLYLLPHAWHSLLFCIPPVCAVHLS